MKKYTVRVLTRGVDVYEVEAKSSWRARELAMGSPPEEGEDIAQLSSSIVPQSAEIETVEELEVE